MCVKHLTVGVFHDDSIGRELGKKGTESDIVMFNRKMSDQVCTFMSPVDDKLAAKSQIISSIDAAVVAFNSLTRELGETVVMLDSLGISAGIAVSSSYVTPDQVAAVTQGTSLKSFSVTDRDIPKLLEILKSYDPKRVSTSAAIVVVDHSFSVKGVGEVVLGFVRKGVVRKFDKLTLLPANKEVLVRSIQIQDEDYDQAETGSRVGLALKGATLEEMKRGSVLAPADAVKMSTSLKLKFTKSSFYAEPIREGAFHITVGMQTIPVMVGEEDDGWIAVNSEKPIVYTEEDTFLLLDLNAKKMRVIGKARTKAS